MGSKIMEEELLPSLAELADLAEELIRLTTK
jgi:hypothetical protein